MVCKPMLDQGKRCQQGKPAGPAKLRAMLHDQMHWQCDVIGMLLTGSQLPARPILTLQVFDPWVPANCPAGQTAHSSIAVTLLKVPGGLQHSKQGDLGVLKVRCHCASLKTMGVHVGCDDSGMAILVSRPTRGNTRSLWSC